VAIEQQYLREAIGGISGRQVEDLDDPLVAEVGIGPSVYGFSYATPVVSSSPCTN
jgi:hypothetical protein